MNKSQRNWILRFGDEKNNTFYHVKEIKERNIICRKRKFFSYIGTIWMDFVNKRQKIQISRHQILLKFPHYVITKNSTYYKKIEAFWVQHM